MVGRICGIYKITSPTGKVYIGQSVDIKRRFYQYKSSNKNNKYQKKLYKSLIKYGYKKHVFEIIEECDFNLLNIRERYWQEYYDVLDRDKGLNLILTSTNELPAKVSQETRDKLSIALKGKKKAPFSKEHRLRLSTSHKGYICKQETKDKMSKAHFNRRAKHHSSKKVLCLQTGIFYDTIKDAANVCGNITYSALRAMLNGQNKNSSNFIKI